MTLPLTGAGPTGGSFDPLSLSPAVYLDPSALALADGTAVSSLTDSSGNGRHAVQATGANQPLLKTNILNGKSVVRFDGSNDSLIAPVPTLTLMTAFVVAKISATTANAGVVVMNDNVGFDYDVGNGSLVWNSGNTGAVATGADVTWRGGGVNVVNMTLATGAFHNYNLRVSGSNGSITLAARADGSALATDTGVNVTAANAVTQMALGCRLLPAVSAPFASVDVAMVLIYNGALSDANRLAVESYLGTRFGL